MTVSPAGRVSGVERVGDVDDNDADLKAGHVGKRNKAQDNDAMDAARKFDEYVACLHREFLVTAAHVLL